MGIDWKKARQSAKKQIDEREKRKEERGATPSPSKSSNTGSSNTNSTSSNKVSNKGKKLNWEGAKRQAIQRDYERSAVARNANTVVNTQPTQSVEEPRDANLVDILWNSAKRGYYNARYGEELYDQMMGYDNKAQHYEDVLAGEDYNFEADGWLGKGVSGAAELIGQQVRQWTNPMSLGMAGAGAAAAGLAGQAGPQVLIPEEVITVPGAALMGLKAGSTKANFEIEAGHAYKEMLDNGVSESTAKKIALGVGAGNAALEFVQLDELVKSFKVLDKVGADDALKDVVKKEIARRGVDVAKETAQEVAQEGVTIAGAQLGSKLDKGEWAYDAGEVAGRLGDTAVSSALSFGVMNVPGGTHNVVSQTKQQKDMKAATEQKNQALDLYLQDEETIDALIQEGKEMGQGSASEQIAKELETKRAKGEEVTRGDVERLVKSNESYIQRMEAPVEAQDAIESLARETVEREMKIDQREAVPQAEAVSRRATLEQQIKRKTGYGQEGVKAFSALLESSEDGNMDALRSRFQSSYELGLTDAPKARVTFDNPIQEAAFDAGKRDYILGMSKAETAVTAHVKAGLDTSGDTTNLPQNVKPAAMPKDVTEAQVKTADTVAKALGVRVRMVSGLKGNAQINGNEVLIDENFQRKVGGSDRSLVFYVAHEIAGHRTAQLAPSEWRAFQNAMIRAQNQGLPAGAPTVSESMTDRYHSQDVNISLEGAMEEVSADAILGLYENEDAFYQAVKGIANGKDAQAKSGARKFLAAIRDVIRKIKESITSKMTKEEREQAKQVLSEVEQLRDKFEAALKRGVENAENALKAEGDGATMGAKNSLKEGKGNDGRKKESTDSFLQRSRENARKNGKVGRAAYSFVPAYRGDTSLTAERTAKELKNLGIKSFYFKNIEFNENGETWSGSDLAYSLGGNRVAINAKAFGNEKEIAGHEAFHIWDNTPAREAFVSALEENMHQLSFERIKLMDLVTAEYFDGIIPKAKSKEAAIFIEEFRAIICGRIYSGNYEESLGKMFRDYDAVKAAWNQMVREQSGATEGNFVGPVTGENVKYSLREKDPPKKTGIAYKVFYAKDGQLYPPMVANPGGAGTPVGVWLDADIGVQAVPSKTGRPQVKAGGKGTQGGSGSLAFRPGWHLGDLPMATQFARKNPETGKKELFPADFVWAECEYAMDHDYQDEAMSYGYTDNGKFRHSYAGLPRLPEDGYYRYRTNPNPDTVPWVITGAMKVNRILTDAETDKILRDAGVEPMKRQGGTLNLEKLGIKAGNTAGGVEAGGNFQHNEKYSLKDSEGNTLTKAQTDFFKDSKARDKDGNLQVYYHGTPKAGFTKFDPAKGRFGGSWFTTSRADADSYAGNYEGKLFDPDEKNSTRTVESGDYRIGSEMRFDTEEDRANFIKENPGAKDYRTKAEIEALMEKAQEDGDWDTYDELEAELDSNARKRIEKAYGRYEWEHAQVKTIGEMLDNPEGYTIRDLVRAYDAYDPNNMAYDTIAEGGTFDDLMDGLRRSAEEEPELREVTFRARIHAGQSGDVIRTVNNRTYAVYLNAERPAEFNGYGRTIMQDNFYEHIEKAMKDEQYDSVIVRNLRTGAHQELGDVVIVKRADQVKLITNKNPTPDNDTRFSLRTDSDGNELTQAQQEFFRDSKIRDYRGRLLKVYHTTNSDFTVFDKAKKGENTGDYNTYMGFFFTDEPEYMGKFGDFDGGNSQEYYINIKNPLDMTNISRKAFMDIVDVMGGDAEDAGRLYDAEMAAERQRARVRRDNNISLTLSSLLEELTGDYYYADFFEELRPVYDELMGRGYDGVISYMDEMAGVKEFVVLESEQAKLVSNKKPTSDPDIRFSLKRDQEYMDAVENDDMEIAQKLVDTAARLAMPDAKTIDSNGNLKHFYHGTARADRVGTVFRADRATSGPMSFFTDDESVAANYAKSKADTSMANDPDYDRYETQFRFRTPDGAKFPIDSPIAKAWGYIPVHKRQEIKKKAGELRFDWDGEDDSQFILEEGNKDANGGFQYQLKEYRNNPLAALTEQWLNSGNLFNEEHRFLEVLEMVGATQALEEVGLSIYFKDPNFRQEGVYNVYLNITHPLDTNTMPSSLADDISAWWDDQDQDAFQPGEYVEADAWDKRSISVEDWVGKLRDDMANNTTYAWTQIPDAVTEYLKQQGYDGIFDRGGKYSDLEHSVVIPFYPQQIKSAAPTTYDNDGHLIPLSERFNTEERDIRWSLKANEDILKENAKLKEVNQDLRSQLKRTEFAKVDRKQLDRFAKKLLKDYESGADINETRKALDELYTYIANGEEGMPPAWNEVQKRAYETAVSILEDSSSYDDSLYQAYKGLRDRLRNNGMTIDPQYDHDLMGYESINEFRKRNMGRIKLVKDGTPVDMVYSELANIYPEFFDEQEYSTQPDQLSHIEEVLASLRPVEINPYSTDMRGHATWLANDIIERFFALPQAKPTFADKAEQKLTKQVIKDAKKLEQVKEKDAQRLASIREQNARKLERERQKRRDQNEKILAETREKIAALRVKEREKRENQVAAVKERYKAKEAKGRETRKARELREWIMKHASDLSEKLVRPSDKHHIPEHLKGPVAAMLDAINLESSYTYDPFSESYKKNDDGLPTRRTRAFEDVRRAYKKILEDESTDMVLDPSLELLFDDVTAMRDIRIADMTSSQLQTIWNLLQMVEHSIYTAGKVLSNSKYKKTTEWAYDFMDETATRKGKTGKKVESLRLDLENPYTFFAHYGKAGKAVYRMLRDAQDKQQDMVMEVQEAVREIVDPKTVKALENETHDFVTAGGKELTLTTAHIMEIFELLKRQQANDHLLKGGIVQPEVKVNGKKIERGTDAILLNPGDIVKITKVLTKGQRDIADAMQKLTTTLLADYGNEASMAAYGYKKFTGKDYWPIKSASEGIHSNVEKGGSNTRSIKNIGMAKSVMPHASNPLDINGLFKTFSDHAADMTDYAAWLLPMEDANRLFNFKFRDEQGFRTGQTMKGLLDRYGGKGAQKYWHNLMEDIQNGINASSDSFFIPGINKVIGNVRAASVGANVRVIIQQPTAILRAATVLNPSDMAKGMTGGVLKGDGWKKALEHSAIAKRKDMGGFDISSPAQMGEILYDNGTKLQKFNEAMMVGASKADALTWGKIWNACEWAVKRKKPSLEGQAFTVAVSELFSEVIDQSQVVDGVLQRSQTMRSGNALVKQATAFMGEPTMALNMMLRAYDAYASETDPASRTKARKALGRTTTVLLVTNLVNALAQSVVDGLRDDDDEKDYVERVIASFTGDWEDGWTAVLSGNAASSVNPMGYVPFAKDILSILQGYNVTRADADVMADIIGAAQDFTKSLTGESKKTLPYATKNLAQQVGKMFGISATNVLRDVWGLVRTIAIETGNVELQYEMEKAILKISNEDNTGDFVDILFRAYEQGSDSYERIYDDMVESGVSEEKIANRMETLMKKAQGVKEVEDLEQRYLSPTKQEQYDKKLGAMQNSGVWRRASESQKDEAESRLYDLVEQNSAGEDLLKDISDGAAFGLNETDYLLYKLALDMVDQPNKSGELGGTPTNEEKAAAIQAVGGLSNSEIAFLWDTDSGYEAYAAGVDMAAYVDYLGDGGSVSTDKLIAAQEAGIGTDTYIDFMEMLKEVDQPTKNGNYGSFTQDEATAAIRAMPGLTREERAYLWQSVNKGWKSKNNPWR